MLDPDPFATWGMTSLGPNSSPGHRLLLGSLGSTTGSAWLEDALPVQMHMRSLLQAGDSSSGLPVLGRVSVREAKSTVSLGSGAGAPQPGSSAAIDDEISAYTPVPPDPSNPAGFVFLEASPSPPPQAPPEQPQLPQSVQDAFDSIARAFTDQGNQRIMIIVAAVVAPLGLLLCLAGILYARQRRHRKERAAKASRRGSDDGFREAQETGVQEMQPHETGYGSVCGVQQPAKLAPSCDSSADGAAAGVARSMFNTLRSSVSGMASGVASAIGMHKGSPGDAYKLQAPRPPQDPGAGMLRGPSLDLQWPPTPRRREPTLPGSRRSLDAPAERPGVSTALPVSRPAARLGQQAVARQLFGQQQQQQPQVGAAQWRPPQQQQGPGDVMWGTPDMQAARSGSVYNNPLAQSEPNSGSGSAGGAAALAGAGVVDAFFLSGGDTFLMPTELAFAGGVSLHSQAPPEALSRPWQRARQQP